MARKLLPQKRFPAHLSELIMASLAIIGKGVGALFGLDMDIAIDLGTASVLVYVKGKGIVIREPSVVAIERDKKRILAIGEEARRMLGRTPGNVVALRPLREGVIADYELTEAMLKHFLAQVSNRRRFFRPRVMVCVPSGVTSVEKRAVIEACGQAGARETFVIEEPLAAALGVGIDITEPSGSMLVDIGGGTTDVAVLSLGGIVVSESLRVGGDRFDEALMRYVKREHNMLIGERTAEELKIEIGTACPDERDGEMDVRGRDLVTGLPKTITVTARETFLGMSEPIMAIVDVVKHVLERTPPELAADIADKGIVMTGGGAKLHGFDTLLARATNTPTHLAEDPLTCVVLGAGRALENYETLQDHVVVLKKVM